MGNHLLNLFTVIWGEEMTRTLLEAALPSILQSGNLPECRELVHTYSFYASEESRKKIEERPIYQKLLQNANVLWFPLQKGEWDTNSDTLHQMEKSASEGNYMFMIPPDHLLGNKSLSNLAGLCAEGKYKLILHGFPRVNEEGFKLATEELHRKGTISNRELVTLAMKHIEQAGYSIVSAPRNWIVKHDVPTPCLLPDRVVVSIFATNPVRFGGFDHVLPYWLIELGYLWHLIRDSDTFFVVERGKHFVHESGPPWDLRRQVAGLELFRKEEAIWRGNA